MRSLILGALAFALLVGTTHAEPAFAQSGGAGEVDEDTRQRARALFGQGVQHATNNEWNEARAAFQQAYDLVREPSILFNLAGAQVESGQLTAGAASYRQFLREVTSGPAARHRREAQRLLTALEARVPKVRVQIPDLEEGDEVRIDGQLISQDALGDFLELDPGEHSLTVIRDGREWAHESFTVRERARDSREIALVAPPAVPTPAETARLAQNGPQRERNPHRGRNIGIGVGAGAGVAIIAIVLAVDLTR